MASLRIYDRAGVSVAGRYIVQNTRVSVDYIGSDEKLLLLGAGTKRRFAISPDTRLMTIGWTMMVPSDDAADFVFLRNFLDCEEVKVSVHLFGQRRALSTTGWIQEPKLSCSVGSSLEYSCSLVGPPGDFQ